MTNSPLKAARYRPPVRWFLAAVLALSVCLVTVTLLNYRTAVRVAEETLRNQGVTLALRLAAEAWSRDARDAAGLQAIVAGPQQQREVAFTAVIDQDGTVLAHTNPRLVGTRIDDAPFRRVRESGQISGDSVTLGTGEEVYELTVPFHVPPPGAGAMADPRHPRFRILRLALHTAPARQIVFQAQAQVLFVGVLVLVLLGLSGWQIRTLRRHLALQEEMARQERLAALGGMAAVLAHEIRNPLGGIKGVAQFLKERPSGEEEHAQMMQAIVVEATRLERLVNDLLSYARPRPPDRRPLDLAATLREVMSFVQPAADAAGVKVRVDAGEPPPRLLADPEQLKQLLANLLLNAIQAMPGGGALTVSAGIGKRTAGISTWTQGSPVPGQADAWVEIGVEDTGPGIPQADLARVFEPFYTTRAKGTGLGLAICRQIVEAHGGSIGVARTGPEGTRMGVLLPQEGPVRG